MVAATAMPIASSVMTVSAPLATDFSARNSVIRTMIPKNPAAASVSHIGKAGERQIGRAMQPKPNSCAMSLNAAWKRIQQK